MKSISFSMDWTYKQFKIYINSNDLSKDEISFYTERFKEQRIRWLSNIRLDNSLNLKQKKGLESIRIMLNQIERDIYNVSTLLRIYSSFMDANKTSEHVFVLNYIYGSMMQNISVILCKIWEENSKDVNSIPNIFRKFKRDRSNNKWKKKIYIDGLGSYFIKKLPFWGMSRNVYFRNLNFILNKDNKEEIWKKIKIMRNKAIAHNIEIRSYDVKNIDVVDFTEMTLEAFKTMRLITTGGSPDYLNLPINDEMNNWNAALKQTGIIE